MAGGGALDKTIVHCNTMQYGGGGDGEGISNSISSGVSSACYWPTGEGKSNNKHGKRKFQMQQSTINERSNNQQQTISITVITGHG